MPARTRMTHRIATSREAVGTTRDAFNQPITTTTTPLTSGPAYWQARLERFLTDGQKVMALGTHFALVPLGTDIREQDYITSVQDRRGNSLFSDRMRVVAVVPREDHLEVGLEVYA